MDGPVFKIKDDPRITRVGKILRKLLPHYLKLAKKHNKNIEIGFHPGYVKSGEKLLDGSRQDFSKFYYSPWRNTEYNTLLNFNYE